MKKLFYWGEAGDALTAGKVKHIDILDLTKLALYETHKTSEIVQKTAMLLQGLNQGCLEDFLSKHIAAIFGKAVSEAKQRIRFWHGDDVDQIPVHVEQAVVRGALFRFNEVQVRRVPSKVSFGIDRTEEFDRNVHTDAVLDPSQRLPDGRIDRKPHRENTSIVATDPFDGKRVVYERWCPILTKGASLDPGSNYSTVWQHYIVPVDQNSISVQLYCTEMDLKEHEQMFDHPGRPNELRSGIEEWGDSLKMELPDMFQHGFKQVYREKMRAWIWEFFCRLRLECNGANMQVKWQIALPGSEPYTMGGKWRNKQIVVTQEEIFEVCDESFNPFPRT